jgi:hypothetical protein
MSLRQHHIQRCTSDATETEVNCWRQAYSVPSSKMIRECIQKFPDWVDNEIYAYNIKNSLRSNTKGYGDKTH